MELTTADLRAQVLDAYGGACVVCGEDDPDLLEFDHVDGGGTQARKSVRGKRFYTQLIKQGFPDALRLLCVSCHCKVTRGQGTAPFPPLHSGIGRMAPPSVTPRDAPPPSQECQELAGVLQGVADRLDRLEAQSPGLTHDRHSGLPAVRSLPAEVVFDTPALQEAWNLQEAARAGAGVDDGVGRYRWHLGAVSPRAVGRGWLRPSPLWRDAGVSGDVQPVDYLERQPGDLQENQRC